ncbi:MAG: transcription elongation factor subunit Spt4 [Candidatus Anstonellales archaeon]
MKACKNCKAIVYEKKCHVCGSTNLAKKFSGLIIILDEQNSIISRKLNLKQGEWAAQIDE